MQKFPFGAVIFDLDGTILNTLDDLTAAISHALNALGLPALDVPTVRRMVGNGVPKLVSRALDFVSPGHTQEAERECLDIFTEYYNAHNADRTRLYDGMAELLDELKNANVPTAVVTNKYDEAAQTLKKRMFPSVTLTVGTRDGIRPKPAPDGVNYALDILRVAKADAIYVGDGETDIQTAKNAGLPVIAVTWGFRDRGELAALSPDGMIDSPTEFFGAANEIYNKRRKDK